jgi:hypothetical protein
MAWMPLTLSCKRLACDGTRQAARNQLLIRKHSQQKPSQGHTLLTIRYLSSKSRNPWGQIHQFFSR